MEIFKKLFSDRKLILASSSPRRHALFQLMNLDFAIQTSDVEEEIPAAAHPAEIVETLSARKAMAVSATYRKAMIVGADTVVVIDGQILGKPADRAEAAAMLRKLSGRTHEVYTGYAIFLRPEDEVITSFEKTAVTFKALEEQEIEAYIRTISPLDKAGAYGIQDLSAVFVTRIEGCFYNVVGFPVANFYQKCCSLYKERYLAGMVAK